MPDDLDAAEPLRSWVDPLLAVTRASSRQQTADVIGPLRDEVFRVTEGEDNIWCNAARVVSDLALHAAMTQEHSDFVAVSQAVKAYAGMLHDTIPSD